MTRCATLLYARNKECAPGGFGVLLARQLVDEIIYGQDGNEVLLIKYLHSAKPKSPEYLRFCSQQTHDDQEW